MRAQREFFILVEIALKKPDISKSVQRFPLAIDEAKIRLDLAICSRFEGMNQGSYSQIFF